MKARRDDADLALLLLGLLGPISRCSCFGGSNGLRASATWPKKGPMCRQPCGGPEQVSTHHIEPAGADAAPPNSGRGAHRGQTELTR